MVELVVIKAIASKSGHQMSVNGTAIRLKGLIAPTISSWKWTASKRHRNLFAPNERKKEEENQTQCEHINSCHLDSFALCRRLCSSFSIFPRFICSNSHFSCSTIRSHSRPSGCLFPRLCRFPPLAHTLHTTYFYCFPAQYRKFFSVQTCSLPFHCIFFAFVCLCRFSSRSLCVMCVCVLCSHSRNYFVVFLLVSGFPFASISMCFFISPSSSSPSPLLMLLRFDGAVYTFENKSSIQLFNHSLQSYVCALATALRMRFRHRSQRRLCRTRPKIYVDYILHSF